jgi:hypothetical protein
MRRSEPPCMIVSIKSQAAAMSFYSGIEGATKYIIVITRGSFLMFSEESAQPLADRADGNHKKRGPAAYRHSVGCSCVNACRRSFEARDNSPARSRPRGGFGLGLPYIWASASTARAGCRRHYGVV